MTQKHSTKTKNFQIIKLLLHFINTKTKKLHDFAWRLCLCLPVYCCIMWNKLYISMSISQWYQSQSNQRPASTVRTIVSKMLYQTNHQPWHHQRRYIYQITRHILLWPVWPMPCTKPEKLQTCILLNGNLNFCTRRNSWPRVVYRESSRSSKEGLRLVGNSNCCYSSSSRHNE